jgi:hypothetical protein
MIIDLVMLQNMVQDSMLDRYIPDYLVEKAVDIVHEKVAVLLYCAQRIEYAIKSCHAWQEPIEVYETYANAFIQQWLHDICAHVDLDRLCGVSVSACRNPTQDPLVIVNVQLLFNETPHFIFDPEAGSGTSEGCSKECVLVAEN